MIRSSFALHGKNKTLRTQEAINNVYSYMHLVDMYDVCRDYEKLNILTHTGSLLVDWREDEAQEEDTEDF